MCWTLAKSPLGDIKDSGSANNGASHPLLSLNFCPYLQSKAWSVGIPLEVVGLSCTAIAIKFLLNWLWVLAVLEQDLVSKLAAFSEARMRFPGAYWGSSHLQSREKSVHIGMALCQVWRVTANVAVLSLHITQIQTWGEKIPNVCFVSPPFLQLKPEECSDRMPPVTMFVKERNTTQIVAVEILVENTHLIFLTFFF